VTGDDELGPTRGFATTYASAGERDVLGVPCHTTDARLEARLPKYQGRGRRPKGPGIGDGWAT